MANYSYLYSSNDSGPPDPDADLVIATGRYFVPAFWIASCTEDDLSSYIDEDDEEMPYVSLLASKAKAQFETNKTSLEAISPEIAGFYEEWSQLLDDLGEQQLKIDASEIIFMTDEDDTKFREAVRFFDEVSESTLNGLLSYSGIPNILDAQDRSKLAESAVGMDEMTELTASDYLVGIRDA